MIKMRNTMKNTRKTMTLITITAIIIIVVIIMIENTLNKHYSRYN